MAIESEIDYALASLIIASSIAIITLGGIIWSNLQTRKSNQLLETELKSKLRPWITISEILPAQIILEDDRKFNWQYYNEHQQEFTNVNRKTVRFVTEITNIGSTPTKLDSYSFQQKNKFTHDEIKTKGNLSELVIMPQQTIKTISDLSYVEYTELRTSPYYFGIHVEYKIYEDIIESIGKIWEVTSGFSQIVESWYS